MTETVMENEEIVEIPPGERFPHARTYEGLEVAADGRNVEMLCVPFNVPAVVADPPPYGDGSPYEEEFAFGAFSAAARAPNRTYLEFEHWSPGMTGILGHAEHLEERPDALYGRFRVHNVPMGDQALEMIHAGVLKAASVFFMSKRHARTASGGIRRLHVTLDRVALCREGSYPQAGVIAVRTAPVVVETAEPASVLPQFDPDLAARAASLGLVVPDRLGATPAE